MIYSDELRKTPANGHEEKSQDDRPVIKQIEIVWQKRAMPAAEGLIRADWKETIL